MINKRIQPQIKPRNKKMRAMTNFVIEKEKIQIEVEAEVKIKMKIINQNITNHVVKDAKKAIKVEKHVTVLCQEIKEGNNQVKKDALLVDVLDVQRMIYKIQIKEIAINSNH